MTLPGFGRGKVQRQGLLSQGEVPAADEPATRWFSVAGVAIILIKKLGWRRDRRSTREYAKTSMSAQFNDDITRQVPVNTLNLLISDSCLVTRHVLNIIH